MSSSQPVPITSDMDYSDLYLNVVLRDLNNDEPFPVRHFPIGSTWSFKIGRGSQNENNLNPRPHNSWFASRVMSREHAEIQVDHTSRDIYITDLASMHGTYMYGRKLVAGEKTKLYPMDVVTFGTDVVRGEHTYRPLRLKFEFGWSDGTLRAGSTTESHQAFTTYVEDATSFDDEVEVIGSSSLTSKGTLAQLKPRTFSVPDSDDSDDESGIDDNTRSSPLTFDEDVTEDIVELGSSKIDAISAVKVNEVLHDDTPEQQPQYCSIYVVEDDQAHMFENDATVAAPRTLEDRQLHRTHDLVTTEDEREDEDDKDFDSEAADFHKHVPEEDSDFDQEDGDTEFDENLDDLEDSFFQGDTIHVPEFLRPATIAGASELYVTTSGKDQDVILPPINGLIGTNCEVSSEIDQHADDDQVVTGNSTQGKTSDKPHGSGRVSIHDIINEIDIPAEPRRKRKADDSIDRDEPDHVKFGDSVISEILPNIYPVVHEEEVKVEKISEEPPRKTIKLENGTRRQTSRGKTFLKYTATAVAGVAVGAVSAVFGLAALPADYFV